MSGAIFLVEVHAGDALGVALHGERAAAQMRQQHRRHADVVINDLPFGETSRRIHHLLQVGKTELLSLYLDL